MLVWSEIAPLLLLVEEMGYNVISSVNKINYCVAMTTRDITLYEILMAHTLFVGLCKMKAFYTTAAEHNAL